jgi:putative transposase
MELIYFSPHAPTEETQNRLPHWGQDFAAYFITFRLADALPTPLRRQWEIDRENWLKHHPLPWNAETEREYHRHFSGAMERWLDQAHGECLLRNPVAAQIVGDALNHFCGERCDQLAWVVMPNHVHVACVPRRPWTVGRLVQSWKGFSVRQLNRRFSRAGTLWQKDYFDRLIRDGGHLEDVIRYIRRNPVKAELRKTEFLLWESEFARGIS